MGKTITSHDRMVFAFGHHFRIEDVPWYVVVPVLYLLIVVFAMLMDQNPKILIPTQDRPYEPGEPQCKIYKDVSLMQSGSIINLILTLEARFEISISQGWRGVRLRLSNSNAQEILRGSDNSNITRLDSGELSISYSASLGGNVTAEVLCGEKLLRSYFLTLPDSALENSEWSFFGESSIQNICISNGAIEFFSSSLISPASIRGLKTVIDRSSFADREIGTERILYLRVPPYYDGFIGDIVSQVLLVSAENVNAKIVIYGDRELSRQLSQVHPHFVDRETGGACAQQFEYASMVRDIADFSGAEIALVRNSIPGLSTGDRKVTLILHSKSDLNLSDEVSLESLNGGNLFTAFSNVSHVVLPFEAPIGILPFIPENARLGIVKPLGFTCQSPLESLLQKTEMGFSTIEGQLHRDSACRDSCNCLSAVKYSGDPEHVSLFFGQKPITANRVRNLETTVPAGIK